MRASFFQAVSNSSWANEGYLVASSITESVSEELRILSDLHGIGVIVLNLDNIMKSEIMLPPNAKQTSIGNRLIVLLLRIETLSVISNMYRYIIAQAIFLRKIGINKKSAP